MSSVVLTVPFGKLHDMIKKFPNGLDEFLFPYHGEPVKLLEFL